MTSRPPELLNILRCPETHQPLRPAATSLIEKLNQKVSAGEVKNLAGQVVGEKLDGGLLREDGRRLYPVRQEIPIMLVDESISLD